jgi:YesN/AraC family two-component response regulator
MDHLTLNEARFYIFIGIVLLALISFSLIHLSHVLKESNDHSFRRNEELLSLSCFAVESNKKLVAQIESIRKTYQEDYTSEFVQGVYKYIDERIKERLDLKDIKDNFQEPIKVEKPKPTRKVNKKPRKVIRKES